MDFIQPLANGDAQNRYRDRQTDPATVAGSVVPADFFNTVLDELLSVITTLGGLQPDPDDHTQVRKAIQIAIAAALPGLATTSAAGLGRVSTEAEGQGGAVGGAVFMTPVTTRRAMQYFGLAGPSVDIASRIGANLDGITQNGIYLATPAAPGPAAFNGGVGQVLHLDRGANDIAIQLFWPANNGDSMAQRFRAANGIWSGWRYHEVGDERPTYQNGPQGAKRLPSGLIHQWGFVTNSGSADATVSVTFPLAFVSQCWSVTFGAEGMATVTSSTDRMPVLISPPSATGFSVVVPNDIEGQRAGKFYWQAIGE